ncbi:MAG: hypothetical protein EOP83_10865 [Verrucomicrobiaceae bacterium]|nr:MAG: hypothetical protein EOP83_10865 [Verrucomicrobiaceae bacterium]
MKLPFTYAPLSIDVNGKSWCRFSLATYDIEEQTALDFMMIEDWCIEHFGDEDKQGRWKCSGWAFWFKDPNDAFQFKLRWM